MPRTTYEEESSNDYNSSSEDDTYSFHRRKRKRYYNEDKLVKKAEKLLGKIRKHNGQNSRRNPKKFGRERRNNLKEGALANSKSKTSEKPNKNPLRKELNNLQGLDFANQAGSLMAQPKQIELLPLADMTKEAGRPEQTTSGV